jgi:hypothetical protein
VPRVRSRPREGSGHGHRCAPGHSQGTAPAGDSLGGPLAGRVLTRGQLIDRIWGADYVGDTKTLDVHIKRLRTKIEEDPANPRYLITVRGLGYKFEG